MPICGAFTPIRRLWRSSRRFRIAAAAFGVFAALWFAWVAAPYCMADPLAGMAAETPVRMVFAPGGECVAVRRTCDWQWRRPVPLDRISPHVVKVILAAEDARFFEHGGVDYAALARAFGQDVLAMRRVSGASTISMQLVALPEAGRRKTLWSKFRQILRARAVELHHSKQEILTEYLNRILFGGKIYGIEAAAQYYFGVSAAEFTFDEAVLLCGLPQKPNAYRPDVYRARALDRMRVVLHLLTRRGAVEPEYAAAILRKPQLRFRDLRKPFAWREKEQFGLFSFAAEAALAEAGEADTVMCSVSPEWMRGTEDLLRRTLAARPGGHDAAAVVLENASGRARVLCSVSDAVSGAAEIDGTRSLRSAGSALKPFIYLEAARAGMIAPETVLIDAPVRFGNYAPGNFDGSFRGPVTAEQALADSLNTPAVRLLAALGERRVLEQFRAFGLLRERSREVNGLALALGSAGHTLRDMANAYRTLARGGLASAWTALENSPAGPVSRVAPESACRMILQMLGSRPLPGSRISCAWKTGTSSNFCDSWCFAVTPEYTVGVWFGNHTGRAVPGMTGRNTAVPAAADLLNMLYAGKTPGEFGTAGLVPAEICAASGLRPGARCEKRVSGTVCADIPLRECVVCRRTGTPVPVRILLPKPESYAGPATGVRLPLRGSRAGMWFVDGVRLGEGQALEHVFAPGPHTVTLFAADGAASAVRLTVRGESGR